MEHFSDLGRIGLGSRFKRLSDSLIAEVNAIYKDAGIQLEASCFPLISLLERYGPQTLREVEEKLKTSHAYVSQKAKALKELGLITIKVESTDRRSKKMALTDKGRAIIASARPYWLALDRMFADMFHPDEKEIFRMLGLLESHLLKTPLREKIHEYRERETPPVVMADYDPAFRQAFADLNLEWLEKSFTLNDFDRQAFSDPEASIIKKGGDVFFALVDRKPAGTAALYPSQGGYELCKMGVDARYRGRGIGETLVAEGIRRARAKKAQSLFLLSNRGKLAPAIRLYEKMGFVETPLSPEDVKKYVGGRVDIRMEYPLA